LFWLLFQVIQNQCKKSRDLLVVDILEVCKELLSSWLCPGARLGASFEQKQ